MSSPKDNLIAKIWLLQFFIIGCLDISFAITSGGIFYDHDNDIFSDSLWLLITGVIMVISSAIYTLTKNIFCVLCFLIISISSVSLFGVVGVRILLNMSFDSDKFMIYFYIYFVNYIGCGGCCGLLIFLLNFLHIVGPRLEKSELENGLNYIM